MNLDKVDENRLRNKKVMGNLTCKKWFSGRHHFVYSVSFHILLKSLTQIYIINTSSSIGVSLYILEKDFSKSPEK